MRRTDTWLALGDLYAGDPGIVHTVEIEKVRAFTNDSHIE
jgi:hypothetical protein